MESWIKTNRSEGTGDSEVDIALDYNTTPSTRRATITAQASRGGSDSLAIAQVGSFCPTLYSGGAGLWVDDIDWDGTNDVPVFEVKGGVTQGNIGMRVPDDFIQWLEDNGLSVWNGGRKVNFTKGAGDINHLMRNFTWIVLSTSNSTLEFRIGATSGDSQPWCAFRYTQE